MITISKQDVNTVVRQIETSVKINHLDTMSRPKPEFYSALVVHNIMEEKQIKEKRWHLSTLS